MRKVEFAPDQLGKEAYENGMYYGAIGNGEKFQLGSMKDVEMFLIEG